MSRTPRGMAGVLSQGPLHTDGSLTCSLANSSPSQWLRAWLLGLCFSWVLGQCCPSGWCRYPPWARKVLPGQFPWLFPGTVPLSFVEPLGRAGGLAGQEPKRAGCPWPHVHPLGAPVGSLGPLHVLGPGQLLLPSAVPVLISPADRSRGAGDVWCLLGASQQLETGWNLGNGSG